MHDDSPDYADMLKRYIAHLKLCTGWSYIGTLSMIEFTDEERQYLHMFERDADRKIESLKKQ